MDLTWPKRRDDGAYKLPLAAKGGTNRRKLPMAATKTLLAIIGVSCLNSCGQPSTVTIEGIEYEIDSVAEVAPETLPSNSDLKMVNGDLPQYAAKLCELDFNGDAVRQCDLLVQADPDSVTKGYLALITTDAGVNIETQIDGCFLVGHLEQWNDTAWVTLKSTAGDFTASSQYDALERSPGDWVVGPFSRLDENALAEVNGNIGEWSFEKKGDNLRVIQGRWSYCDHDVDDVFRHVLTLTKVSREHS